MMNTDPKPRILDALVDQQLSAVVFIQDYLQLEFDGKRLTINVWPTVSIFENTFRIGHTRYRDALCELIGKQVTSTSETEAKIVIAFDIGQVTMNLADDTAIEHVTFEDAATRTWAYW